MKHRAPLNRNLRTPTAELEPIEYTPEPFVPAAPVAKVIELDGEHGWAAWDSAVAELDEAQGVTA